MSRIYSFFESFINRSTKIFIRTSEHAAIPKAGQGWQGWRGAAPRVALRPVPSEAFEMTDEETRTDAVEDPDSPAAMIGDMRKLLDEQREEIERLKKERSDLMRELMRTTPTAAPPKEAPEEDPQARYDAFKAKVLKKAYDIVEARM